MNINEWWHKRTDNVEGINKLIGEEGSMFREHIVKPIALIVVVFVVWMIIKDE